MVGHSGNEIDYVKMVRNHLFIVNMETALGLKDGGAESNGRYCKRNSWTSPNKGRAHM